MRVLQAGKQVIVSTGVCDGYRPGLTLMRQSIETGETIEWPELPVAIVAITSPIGLSKGSDAPGARDGVMAVPA